MFCVILKSVLLGYLLVPGCIIIFFNGSGLNWFLVVCLAGLIGVIFCVWLQPVEEPSYVYQCPLSSNGEGAELCIPVSSNGGVELCIPVSSNRGGKLCIPMSSNGRPSYVYQCPIMEGLVMYTSVQ